MYISSRSLLSSFTKASGWPKSRPHSAALKPLDDFRVGSAPTSRRTRATSWRPLMAAIISAVRPSKLFHETTSGLLETADASLKLQASTLRAVLTLRLEVRAAAADTLTQHASTGHFAATSCRAIMASPLISTQLCKAVAARTVVSVGLARLSRRYVTTCAWPKIPALMSGVDIRWVLPSMEAPAARSASTAGMRPNTAAVWIGLKPVPLSIASTLACRSTSFLTTAPASSSGATVAQCRAVKPFPHQPCSELLRCVTAWMLAPASSISSTMPMFPSMAAYISGVHPSESRSRASRRPYRSRNCLAPSVTSLGTEVRMKLGSCFRLGLPAWGASRTIPQAKSRIARSWRYFGRFLALSRLASLRSSICSMIGTATARSGSQVNSPVLGNVSR
mmetsp:Transcript_36641/g.103346  ORF Transcript_36641/g.103346 Transcript_36641/m.103346 type:complete len:392 (+) Transcript_36641:87-1262(+)